MTATPLGLQSPRGFFETRPEEFQRFQIGQPRGTVRPNRVASNRSSARGIGPAIRGEVRIPGSDHDCIRFEQLEGVLLCQQHVAENERPAWLETPDADAAASGVQLLDILMQPAPDAIASSAFAADNIEILLDPVLIALARSQVLHEQISTALIR